MKILIKALVIVGFIVLLSGCNQDHSASELNVKIKYKFATIVTFSQNTKKLPIYFEQENVPNGFKAVLADNGKNLILMATSKALSAADFVISVGPDEKVIHLKSVKWLSDFYINFETS